MRDRNSYKKEIENKLLALLRKKSLVEAGEGIFMALLMISLFVLIAALAEYILVLNVPERTVLFVLLVISSAGALVNYILLPLFKMPGIFFKPDYKITALEAGKNFPEIKDELSIG